MVIIKKRCPDPFFYSSGKTGILLVHGFTGSPSELRPLGKYLHEKGYTISAPLLKGHGTTLEDFKKTGWKDWYQSALDAYDQLYQKNDLDKIYVVGLSMGGCISLYLSTQRKVNGVVSLCAPVWVKDKRFHFVHYAKYVMPSIPRKPNSCKEIESYIYPYERTPLACISELKKLMNLTSKNLDKVTAPALIVQSEKDETVIPKSAQYIYDHISSAQKKLSWYKNSSHIIVIDKERNKLFQEINDFIETDKKRGIL